MSARSLPRALPALLSIAFLACDAGPIAIPPGPAALGSIDIESEHVPLERTRTVQLRAIVRDAEGRERTDAAVAWSSRIPGIASVSPEGIVTGLVAGETRITASVAGLSDSVRVEVIPLPIRSIRILADTLVLGEEGLLRPPLVLLDLAGDTVQTAVAWTTTDPGVVAVNEDGRLRAGRRGTVRLTARAGAVADTVEARVVTGYRDVATGFTHTCAVRVNGAAYCWGKLVYGAAGTGQERTITGVPGPVHGDLRFRSLTAANRATCGVTLDQAAWCWGNNEHGELGNGRKGVNSLLPEPVAGGLRFVEVRAGDEWTCGLDLDAALYCWGYNAEFAAAAPPGYSEILTPRRVETPRRFAALAAGGWHGCALSEALADEGRAFCWGADWNGQLGRGPGDHTGHEPKPADASVRFAQVASGLANTCALDIGGALHCWGKAYHSRPAPVRGAPTFQRLATGSLAWHRCAMARHGEAWCWGENEDGQLGDGTAATRYEPAPVAGDVRFRQIATGYAHTCGISVSNALYCWGRGEAIGAGDITESPVPRLVVEPDGG